MDTTAREIDAAARLAVILTLVEKLKACYVYPNTSEEISVYLEKRLSQGAYADMSDGSLFALALTIDLQEINHDEHLWVRWHSEALPDEDSLRQDPRWLEERRLEARLENFGFHKAERLPGNIALLDLRYLHRPEWASDTLSAAMNFLAGAEALIIDLRKCSGGYPAAIALLCSYLFGEEPIHTSSIYWRDENITQEYWTQPEVPDRRFSNGPIFVLISQATFSAGEELAAVLQTRNRATLLGEKTVGGSHPGASFRIHPHFEAFIPIGRAINPMTGQELEGIGVTPDIILPQEQAFKAAYSLALKGVLESANKSPLVPYRTLAKEAQAVLDHLKT